MAAPTNGPGKICASPGCEKEASFLSCPKCKEEGITNLYFCEQACFSKSYKEHKKIHKKKAVLSTSSNDVKITKWPSYAFTGPLRPYEVTKMRKVPDTIPRPDYADNPDGYPASERAMRGSTMIEVLDDESQEDLRIACKLGREVLDVAYNAVAIGITTEEIDALVHEACVDRECYPSPLNYYNFPKSCCTSVNEVICHGIPDKRPLENKDIVNIDITTFHRGYHGDLNETFFVGEIDEESKKLVQATNQCLMDAIDIVKPGVKYREIGSVIQKHAQANGFSVVRSYCGHGIHKLFHTAPSVPHYSKNKAIGVMKAGHSFTIEPMISTGTWRDQTWPDNWTAVTVDGKRSAQFEHTLLVTETGCDILTARPGGVQAHFLDQIQNQASKGDKKA